MIQLNYFSPMGGVDYRRGKTEVEVVGERCFPVGWKREVSSGDSGFPQGLLYGGFEKRVRRQWRSCVLEGCS